MQRLSEVDVRTLQENSPEDSFYREPRSHSSCEKQDEIKRQLNVIRQSVKQAVDAKTCHIQQLQQYLFKLEIKRADFLSSSDNVRERLERTINQHFDGINKRASEFIDTEASKVHTRKTKAEKSLEAVSSRLQTLRRAGFTPGRQRQRRVWKL